MNDFATRLLRWFDRHGRRDLPWQGREDPYAVWISEVMLQQTQVTTVIPYYEKFISRFPDVGSLAAASLDEVMHLWSGLGYYARARNLHRAACRIVSRHGGIFPQTLEEAMALPGIGRSSAGAILSLALGQRHPILDGNAKRVLARHAAIEGWPGQAAVSKALWSLAEERTPERRVADYNQAMMDLGATCCTRNRPDCGNCPVGRDCLGRRQGRPEIFPGRRPRRDLPVHRVQMLLVRDDSGRVLLERRPLAGVWGGLWSLPELAIEEDVLEWCRCKGLGEARTGRRLPRRRHRFTHFCLDISPVEILLQQPGCRLADVDKLLWHDPARPVRGGYAAPVRRLLEEIQQPGE